MDKKYLLQPEKKIKKQGYFMTDENDSVVYEAKMLTQPLFGPMQFEFVNHISGRAEEHKVGKTLTSQTSSGYNGFSGIESVLSTKSRFKFDDKNIWDYLHEQGVRLDSHIAGGKLGMAYDVSLRGNQIAHIATSTPQGKSVFTSRSFLEVVCDESDLDLAFLVAFAIARTEQLFYR